MELESIKCPSCGGDIRIVGNKKTYICEYCGSSVARTDLFDQEDDDEKKIEGLFYLAERAIERDNLNEAASCYKKILMIDVSNEKARQKLAELDADKKRIGPNGTFLSNAQLEDKKRFQRGLSIALLIFFFPAGILSFIWFSDKSRTTKKFLTIAFIAAFLAMGFIGAILENNGVVQ